MSCTTDKKKNYLRGKSQMDSMYILNKYLYTGEMYGFYFIDGKVCDKEVYDRMMKLKLFW
jgi:hypothetical protein